MASNGLIGPLNCASFSTIDTLQGTSFRLSKSFLSISSYCSSLWYYFETLFMLFWNAWRLLWNGWMLFWNYLILLFTLMNFYKLFRQLFEQQLSSQLNLMAGWEIFRYNLYFYCVQYWNLFIIFFSVFIDVLSNHCFKPVRRVNIILPIRYFKPKMSQEFN